jgi:hypothetical protein
MGMRDEKGHKLGHRDEILKSDEDSWRIYAQQGDVWRKAYMVPMDQNERME